MWSDRDAGLDVPYLSLVVIDQRDLMSGRGAFTPVAEAVHVSGLVIVGKLSDGKGVGRERRQIVCVLPVLFTVMLETVRNLDT